MSQESWACGLCPEAFVPCLPHPFLTSFARFYNGYQKERQFPIGIFHLDDNLLQLLYENLLSMVSYHIFKYNLDKINNFLL